MKTKSVREMSALERKQHSLQAKTFRGMLMNCIFLGLGLLITGLGLYSYSLTKQYISHAFNMTRVAAQSANRGTDTALLASSIMGKYRSLTDEQRELIGTDEYRAFYEDEQSSEMYDILMHMLPQYCRSEEIADLYIGMYDEGTRSLVYIADPDTVDRRYPGDWEPIADKELNTFLNWDGKGMLYDIDNTEAYGWMCTVGYPVHDPDGNVAYFVLADLTIDNIWAGMKVYVIQITVVLLAVMAIMLFRILNRIKKTLVTPLNQIVDAAEAYTADKKNGVRETDHFSKLNIRTGDEIEDLYLTMADMEKDMTGYIDNLASVTAEKERISTELSVATRIQAAMLPHIFPAFPDRPEFDIYATMDPAKEVGGDFYDYFLIDNDHLCMVMADVSGKGVPAALFMMASKIILANYAKMGKSPAEILTITNDAICANNKEEMFVTVWIGILEISTGKLIASNAGHEYPVLKQGDSFEIYKDRHGMVIGYEAGMKYTDYEIQLKPGDKIFLYTDGVPEATDHDENLFGMDRMIQALNKTPDAIPEQILKHVRKSVDEFVNEAEQFDDLTMLCFEYRSPSRS